MLMHIQRLGAYQFYVKIIHQKLKEKRLWQKLQSFFYPKIKDGGKIMKTIGVKFRTENIKTLTEGIRIKKK